MLGLTLLVVFLIAMLALASVDSSLAQDTQSAPDAIGSVKVDCDSTEVVFHQLNDYQPYIAGGPVVTVWLGKRVALVLDGEKPGQRDPEVMARICATFDDIFNSYQRIIQRKPKLDAPLMGRIRIEVSSQVGGGLANHGQLGVAVGTGFFNGLYNRVKAGKNTYDQVFFYEIARNFWMPDMNDSIDYHTSQGPDDWGWWTVGFNNAMSVVMSKQVPGIDDMFYFGQNGRSFAAGMETNLDQYLAHPEKYDWENSWCVRLLPWKANTSLNDLMTGLLLRLEREHGGVTFISALYREIPRQRPLPKNKSDYQAVRDNFYAAASLAAKQDLWSFFTSDLRWLLTDSVHNRVRHELGLGRQ